MTGGPAALVLALLPAAQAVLHPSPLPAALAVAALLWAMGASALAATGRMWPALLAQGASFVFTVDPVTAGAALLLAAAGLAMARAHRAGDLEALAAGAAVGGGIAADPSFAALAVAPLLLMDRRRLAVYAAAALVGAVLPVAAAGAGQPFPLVMAAALVLSLPMLVAYFRLRRRGLIEADPLARLLAGLVAAEGLALAVGAVAAASLLAGPQLAILLVMSRRLIPARGHARAWTAVSVAVAAAWAVAFVRHLQNG